MFATPWMSYLSICFTASCVSTHHGQVLCHNVNADIPVIRDCDVIASPSYELLILHRWNSLKVLGESSLCSTEDRQNVLRDCPTFSPKYCKDAIGSILYDRLWLLEMTIIIYTMYIHRRTSTKRHRHTLTRTHTHRYRYTKYIYIYIYIYINKYIYI